MVVFPNSKINLGLSVVAKRADGYHDLETVFYPFPLRDALEIIRLPETGQTHFQQSGIALPGGDNLCMLAYQLLKEDFKDLPPVAMWLHKNIPAGAGLGGGSADAAFTLAMLNRRFDLNISGDRLHEYALQLGSDVPFFLVNKPVYATGRGDVFEPVDLDLSGYQLLLVNPGIHVNTAGAFAGIIPRRPEQPIAEVIRQPVTEWPHLLFNDFEAPVFDMHPEIAAIKQRLYQHGALYASMTGSGSTVYGIFNRDGFTMPDFPATYFTALG